MMTTGFSVALGRTTGRPPLECTDIDFFSFVWLLLQTPSPEEETPWLCTGRATAPPAHSPPRCAPAFGLGLCSSTDKPSDCTLARSCSGCRAQLTAAAESTTLSQCGLRWRFRSAQTRQRESHLNRQQESQSCPPSVAAPSVPRSPKTLRHSDLGPAQPAGPLPFPPEPPCSGRPPTDTRGGAAAAVHMGPAARPNGPSSSRFLLLPGVNAGIIPAVVPRKPDIHSGYGASRGTRRRAWIY